MTAKRPRSKKTQPRTRTAKRWSQRVTKTSDALDLEAGIFKRRSAKAIASSLKRSAERSKRRKASPYQAAMSMLTFYLNRAGKQLSAAKKQTLERAKDELRALFDKPAAKPRGRRGRGSHLNQRAGREARKSIRSRHRAAESPSTPR